MSKLNYNRTNPYGYTTMNDLFWTNPKDGFDSAWHANKTPKKKTKAHNSTQHGTTTFGKNTLNHFSNSFTKAQAEEHNRTALEAARAALRNKA